MKAIVRKAQRGITLLGLLIGMVVAGCFIMFGVKVFPMYMESMAVYGILEGIKNEPGIANKSQVDILKQIDLRLAVEGVKSVQAKDFKFTRKGGLILSIKYESRTQLVANLDIVGRFEKSVSLSGTI